MNRALLPEMLRSSAAAPDVTVLERQMARLNRQQEHNYHQSVFQLRQRQDFQGGDLGEVVIRPSIKPAPGFLENSCCWTSNTDDLIGSAIDINFASSRTYSCPPPVAAEVAAGEAVLAKGRKSVAPEKLTSVIGSDSFKKRKAIVADVNFDREKSIKTCEQGEADSISKITDKNSKNKSSSSKNCNKERCADNSRDNSKLTEIHQKPDYIHVRARRGQATDSHSLAERVRREKISERMKYLQDLVPGCNKITGKAGMLDEIINYVQSLQRQVEFLSMKLAAVNPTRLDFDIDNLLAKEMLPHCQTNFSEIGMSSESDMNNPAYLQIRAIQQQQLVTCCGLDMEMINTPEMRLRRTISAPVSVPQSYIGSSCFNQIQQSSTWDSDLQNITIDQGRSTYFPASTFCRYH